MLTKLLPPALAALCAAAMVATHHWTPLADVVADPLRWAGWLVLAGGVALAVTARVQFARVRTNIYTFDEPGTLVTGGAFRLSRHPMYLGFTLALAGLAWWLGSVGAMLWALVFGVITDRWYMRFEERRLHARFGSAYAEYARRTRRWL